MYSICKETHAPTGVEMSCYCYFFNRREKNLVVAGSNCIRVFRFVPDVYENSVEGKPPKMNMECLSEFRFQGTLLAMEGMPLSLARDALLLTFETAKLSIVEYDPETHDLRTISLHYFETEDLKGGSTQKFSTMLRIDPENRCAALLVYGRQLVVIPFLKKDAVFEEQFVEIGDVKPNIASLNRIPALRSYTVDLRELEEKIDNVVDFKFLHGYYEPTLVLIHEPVRTYVGRLSIRQDTCCLVAVSLNILQKAHPCIWTVNHLPHDCSKLLAVPAPIGGLLIMAQNSIIYLNQSVPPYAVSLNSLATKTTTFPLKPQQGVVISLDACQAEFISHDKILLSLKGGELYIMTLLTDAMRTLRGFYFDKAASSVLTCCLCVCDKDYVFLGSRLGNSLLLRLNEKLVLRAIDAAELRDYSSVNGNGENSSNGTEDDDHISTVKRVRLSAIEDEIEVYGGQRTTIFNIMTYSFDVCDSLLNIGPCGNMTIGERSFFSDDFSSEDPDLELVTTSGHGKNGAICVLQRSIRPQIVTTISINGLIDLWTLFPSHTNSRHGLIVVSQQKKSIVLQAGEEINQLHDNGFRTDCAVVYVCNIGNSKFIAQVYPTEIKLMKDTIEVQTLDIRTSHAEIVYAVSCDPYILLLTQDGQLIVVTFDEERLTAKPTPFHKRSKILTMSCYCDTSGLFTVTESSIDTDTPEEQIVKLSKLKRETTGEDDLLYGNPDEVDTTFKEQQSANTERWWRQSRRHKPPVQPSYWIVIARDNGSLEIFTLPDMQLRMSIYGFSYSPKILAHTTQRSLENLDPETPKVHEILLVGLGYLSRRPILFARIGEDVYLYEAYPYYEDTYEDVLKLRFAKISHPLIVRGNKGIKTKADKNILTISSKCYFKHFPYLGGYSGVFLCGPYPHWIFMTGSGQIRYHPMGMDSKVISFAPFINQNCPEAGFIYCNAEFEFKICMLPKHMSYDAPWPIRKVPLRCTPHFIIYHVESKLYAVALSAAEHSTAYYRITADDKELTQEARDERFPLPLREKYSIKLFSASTWEVIPETSQDMEPFETILCLKVVDLCYEGARSGLRGYLAVGTSHSFGEDASNRGRIMIIDVIEVEPEPGQPLTKNKCKILYSKEQKGPVTAVCSVVGFLCAAVGQKLYLWQLKDNDLIGIAFIDTHIYIHQLYSVKNLIYIADVYKSVSLFRFQETHRTIAVVSRDCRPLESYGINFLVDNTQLGLLAADGDKNLIVFMFQPQISESAGGHKLVRRGDFHLGHHVLTFARVKCKVSDFARTRNAQAIEKRQVTFYATLDGSVGFILPVLEKTYRRLFMLQNVLTNILPHNASLNPRDFRALKTSDRAMGNPNRGIIDGDLTWEFLNLSWPERRDVAKKIGCTIDEIMEDLIEIDRISAHF